MKQQYYQLPAETVARALDTWPLKGLDQGEVKERQAKYGSNQLAAAKRVSPLKLFLGQFKDILIIVLIVAACVSLAISLFTSHQKTLTGGEKLSYYKQEAKEESEKCLAITCPDFSVNITEETVKQLPDPVISEQESPTEALLIFGIVLAIAVVGFLNEYKAEKTVEALSRLVGHKARVRRNGEMIDIPADELVPGDIVLLEEGMKIPADLRLLEARALRMSEASLTGESEPVGKHADIVEGAAALGDQRNMAFSSTLVTTGTGEGVVVATGPSTQIGLIAGLVNEVEVDETPMQKKLDRLGKQLGFGVMLICAVVFVVIFFLDKELTGTTAQRLLLAFTAAVALAVAAIPEGLAFVVRISLALGARRMAAKHALVRRLSAVEALGSTDTICSDKTGTLTKGEMTVREIFFEGTKYEVSGSGYATTGEFTSAGKTVNAKDLAAILEAGMYANNARLQADGILGDPTEAALLVSAAKAGITVTTRARVNEIPFSSQRKRMSVVYQEGSAFRVSTKGALESVLAVSTHILIKGKSIKLSAAHKQALLGAQHDMAGRALRVLAFATKLSSAKPTDEKTIESGLTLIGLQGMMDPPRLEVVDVIHRVTAEAGMRVIMITGDHIDTAQAVAKEIGLIGEAISGVELDALSQAEFERRVEKISVYARVNPEHKIRIVQALKRHGHQVAMTGDGVNDAPAIKAADIGIAMGITGTDATKEAADLILLDDQFLTIIAAIEEGRGIFDNVRKFVNYLLSANIAEVITVLLGVLIFQDLVLTAVQLLFINIVTDGLPAIALGSDPAEKGIMRYRPRHFQGSILNRRIWAEMFIFGFLMSVVLLAQYAWADHDGSSPQAAAFTAMVVYELVRLIDIRTDYRIRWFANPWLSVSILGSFALLLSVLYIKPLADLFGLGPISGQNWLIIAGGSGGLFVVMKLLNPLLDRWQPEIRS
jgi:Ca2+-transporting ATPase